MHSLETIVSSHLSACIDNLERLVTSEEILKLLARLACIYLVGTQTSPAEPADGNVKAWEGKLLALIAAGQRQAVQDAFWSLESFNGFAQVALSAATPSVLDAWVPQETEAYFYRFFWDAPAHTALSVLAQYLASTQPVDRGTRGNTQAAAVGAATAAKMLVCRFLGPGSKGIQELTKQWDELNHGTFAGNLQEMGRRERKMQESANLLVSLPERAACMWLPELRADRYFPWLAGCLLAEAERSSIGTASTEGAGVEGCKADSATETCSGVNRGGEASRNASESSQAVGNVDGEVHQDTPSRGAIEFLGLVLSKLARRGCANQVADAIWRRVRLRLGQGSIQWQDPRANPLMMVLRTVTDAAAAEKLLEAMVRQASASGIPGGVEQEVLGGFISRGGFLDCVGVTAARYLLVDKLLLHSTLPPLGLSLHIHLISHLQAEPSLGVGLPQTMLVLAEGWGSRETIDRLPAPRQSYMTAALILCLQRTTKAQLEATPGLLTALLRGVGARLDNPTPCLRMQGMRLGNRLAQLLDADKPLFGESGSLDILREEWWHPDCAGTEFGVPPLPGPQSPGVDLHGIKAEDGIAEEAEPFLHDTNGRAGIGRERLVEGFRPQPGEPSRELLELEGGAESNALAEEAASQDGTATDSDDESLVAYDLKESNEEDIGVDGDRPLQLREVAEMIRKAEDSQAVVKGLSLLPTLIEAATDELANYSGELARSLLHCHPPEWGDAEADTEEQKSSFHRLWALTSLLVEVPREAGLSLAAEVYSPHLDLHQRLVVLDTLSAAALQMSTPPSRAKAALEMQAADRGEGGNAVALDSRGKERRWGLTSLALRNAEKPKTFRNRFPEVAVEWTSALLEDCGRERHGVDLFGRDNLLLGRLLTTLGAFVQASAPSLPTSQIAATTLEMLRTSHVHGHPQPYVRRSALVAASAILAALPPARLAGAMTGGRGDLQDNLLVERLEWLRSWLAATTANDPDSQVRYLAAGCQTLQSELAAKALEHLENEHPTALSLTSMGPSELLGVGTGYGHKSPAFNIKLPLPG